MSADRPKVEWVSATDAGTYSYCGRMYWLTRVKNQKVDEEANIRLVAGHEHHEAHGQTVGQLTVARKHASEALWYSGLGACVMWLGVQFGISGDSQWIDAAMVFVAMSLAFTLRYIVLARQIAKTARLPEHATVVESDTAARRGRTLRDPGRGLYGRPDYILEEMVGGKKKLVPVEIKPTKKSTRLFESDEMQLVLYLLILEHMEPLRSACFGRVIYGTNSFEVTLTERLRSRLMEIAENVRAARKSENVDRTHNVPGRCGGCSVRQHCGQSLAPSQGEVKQARKHGNRHGGRNPGRQGRGNSHTDKETT